MRSNRDSFLNLLIFIYSTIFSLVLFFEFTSLYFFLHFVVAFQIQPYQPRSYISVDRHQRHQSPSASKHYNFSSPSGNYFTPTTNTNGIGSGNGTNQQQISLSTYGLERSNGVESGHMHQPDVSDLHQSLLMTNSITRVYQSVGGVGGGDGNGGGGYSNGSSSYDKVFQ